jgi:hypothetical protein
MLRLLREGDGTGPVPAALAAISTAPRFYQAAYLQCNTIIPDAAGRRHKPTTPITECAGNGRAGRLAGGRGMHARHGTTSRTAS